MHGEQKPKPQSLFQLAPLAELRDLAQRQKYGEAIDLLQRIERGLRSKLPGA